MKKLICILILALIPAITSAQTFISEDFSGDFPPAGWTTDSHAANWHSSLSENAGGTAPEATFDWDPQFSGTSRFLSPRVDLTGITELKVQFRHMVDHYAVGYTIGVATRHGTSAWNVVWSRVNPNGDIGPEVISADITNGDVGTPDFQICWYFSGNSFNIDYWYFDDLLLFSPLDHDVKVASIDLESQYTPGSLITPRATVENFGNNAETFDVNCRISIGQNNVYDQTIAAVSLDPGETASVDFPQFTISEENELYEIIAATLLSGDLAPSNDTLNAWFNTYTTPRDMVMLEIGTGTWCQYCPGAAMGAEDMIDNGHNVAVVEYHAANGDPFENEFSLARVDYYGISGFPTAVFDGISKLIGGDHDVSMYDYYLPLFEEREPINSAFSVEIFGEHSGDNYTLLLRVTKHARIPYENMVLHVALTESGISFNWQGQDHLEWVERLMIPDANGTILDFNSQDVQIIPLEFAIDPSWDDSECELAAFIQNTDDKEVLQASKIMVSDLTPLGAGDDMVVLPTETRLLGNYPNPFNPSTRIDYTLKAQGQVSLEVFNILGQKIRTLVNSPQPAGNHSAIWDSRDNSGNEVTSGAYFYRLVAGNYISTKRMVLTK